MHYLRIASGMELIHRWSQGRINLLPSWHAAGTAKLLAWVCRWGGCEQPEFLKVGALSSGSSGWRSHWGLQRSHPWRLQPEKVSRLQSELMGINLLIMLELNRQGNHWLLNPVPTGAAISPTRVNYSMYPTVCAKNCHLCQENLPREHDMVLSSTADNWHQSNHISFRPS